MRTINFFMRNNILVEPLISQYFLPGAVLVTCALQVQQFFVTDPCQQTPIHPWRQ